MSWKSQCCYINSPSFALYISLNFNITEDTKKQIKGNAKTNS